MTQIPLSPAQRPVIRFQQNRSKRLRGGHPWAFSNEIQMTAEAKALPAGSLITLQDANGEPLGVGTFNPHSLIAVRMLSRNAAQVIDAAWLAERLSHAAALRDALIGTPYYRLIHSEADGLPGLIVDRYGDVVTVQANSVFMDQRIGEILGALDSVLNPSTVILRNDGSQRALEGLPEETRLAKGALDGALRLEENGNVFFADPLGGQKSGWFYDQRDNRAFMAKLAKGRRVLDVYTYAGGFAVTAAMAGAASVTAVDRSEHSLALAEGAVTLNGANVQTVRAEAYAELARLDAAGERFGVVIVDPPAFVKSKKDLHAGAKGYRKMAKLAAPLVEPGGFLFCASCSHHMPVEMFAEEIAHGIHLAGRSGRIIRSAGAAPDHPVHPMLPESAYLKALVLQLD